jgi:hypothetical protein
VWPIVPRRTKSAVARDVNRRDIGRRADGEPFGGFRQRRCAAWLLINSIEGAEGGDASVEAGESL